MMANEKNSNQINGKIPSKLTTTPTPRRVRGCHRPSVNWGNHVKPPKKFMLTIIYAMGIAVTVAIITVTSLWIDDGESYALPYKYAILSLMIFGGLLFLLNAKIKSDVKHDEKNNHPSSRFKIPYKVHELDPVSGTLLQQFDYSDSGNMILASISDDEEVDVVQTAVKEHLPVLLMDITQSYRRYIQCFDTTDFLKVDRHIACSQILQRNSLQQNSLQQNSLQPNSLQQNSLQPNSLQPNSLQPDSLQHNRWQPKNEEGAVCHLAESSNVTVKC